ncbi:hypothetical protein QBC36DRAFT_285739 [Triangularia setosa]|uniref:Uncharacterized protein n=1 Tax=Triangularia setosa TaxID=2587417 RepID=A0AAN7ACX1_9PEZI|nr:hypothetical protein QBC36DRAFT_285739 [Podospora setosa]
MLFERDVYRGRAVNEWASEFNKRGDSKVKRRAAKSDSEVSEIDELKRKADEKFNKLKSKADELDSEFNDQDRKRTKLNREFNVLQSKIKRV